MKTRKFRLMAVLTALLATMTLQAQVTIGSLEAPKAGTILDLNTATKGGLLFPNVELTGLSVIPTTFVGTPDIENNGDLTGLVVYNTYNGGDITPGLYIWDGENWRKLTDSAALTLLKNNITALTSLLDDKANTTYVDGLVGELSSLKTLDQSSVVAGINILKDSIGTLTSLTTVDKTSIVQSINSLGVYVEQLLKATELPGSPFDSYTAFLGTYPNPTAETVGKYAYVTFTGGDVIPGAWQSKVAVGASWRIDGGAEVGGSTYKFSPTTNMTAAITAILVDYEPTGELPTATQHTVSEILQRYRDNLKDVYAQFANYAPLSDTYTKAEVTNLIETAITTGLQRLYPVGSIYTSVSIASIGEVASTLGFGTWEAFGAGKVMVGYDGSDASFNPILKTGGVRDAIVPSHTHTFTGIALPGHTHTNNTAGSAGAIVTNVYNKNNGGWSTPAETPNTGNLNMNGALTSVSAGIPAGTISEVGVSVTNANLQPYVVVYMYRRTN